MRSFGHSADVPHHIADSSIRLPASALDAAAAADERLAFFSATTDCSTPLLWCLTRSEALASSDVAGISTTPRLLSLFESFQAQRGKSNRIDKQSKTCGSSPSDGEALGAVRATAYATACGMNQSEAPSIQTVHELHRRLFAGNATDFNLGEFREGQFGSKPYNHPDDFPDRQTGSDARPARLGESFGGATMSDGPRGGSVVESHHVSPPHDLVPALMDDLVRHLSSEEIGDSVRRAALAHLQLASICPYERGNGRIGRALIQLMFQRSLIECVPVPVSAAIAHKQGRYYESLRPYQTYVGAACADERGEAAAAAIEFLADATMVACSYAEAVELSIAQARQQWDEFRMRSNTSAAAILDVIGTAPILTPMLLEHIFDGRFHSRSVGRGLDKLVELGALITYWDDMRGVQIFEVPRMLDVVDRRGELLEMCWHRHEAGSQEPVSAMLGALPSTGPDCGQPERPKGFGIGPH